MRVWDICTHHAVDIPPQASLTQAAETMRRDHVGLLVVCEPATGKRNPVGVITDRDIVVSALALGLSPDTLTVADLMVSPVATVLDDDGAFAAIRLMRDRGIRRLPVLNAAGTLVGLLSADDVWGGLAHQLTALSHAMVQEQRHEMRRRA